MSSIFILVGSCGSWDDYRRINIGVYDSEESAKEAGERFLEKRNSMLDSNMKKCPVTPEQLKGIEENYNFSNLTESESDLYYSWWNVNNMLSEINNGYFIEELKLNVDSFGEIVNFDEDGEWI
jgi:hypothetical protein